MFVNHTNHGTASWNITQLQAAEKYGEVMDFPFPEIDATSTREEVVELAEKTAREILAMKPAVVMVQGEFTYSYAMIRLLKEAGVKVVAACSERNSVEVVNEAGECVKKVVFRFVQFREYL